MRHRGETSAAFAHRDREELSIASWILTRRSWISVSLFSTIAAERWSAAVVGGAFRLACIAATISDAQTRMQPHTASSSTYLPLAYKRALEGKRPSMSFADPIRTLSAHVGSTILISMTLCVCSGFSLSPATWMGRTLPSSVPNVGASSTANHLR